MHPLARVVQQRLADIEHDIAAVCIAVALVLERTLPPYTKPVRDAAQRILRDGLADISPHVLDHASVQGR